MDAINNGTLEEELVVDPSEVFPDLGDNQPVEDPEPALNAGQGNITPDPASDAGGEASVGVGNRPVTHSDGEDSDETARYGSIVDELPDPPLDDLVLDDQTYQQALNQTALSDNNRDLLAGQNTTTASAKSNMAAGKRRVATPQVCGTMTPMNSQGAASDSSSSSSSEEEKKKKKKKKSKRK